MKTTRLGVTLLGAAALVLTSTAALAQVDATYYPSATEFGTLLYEDNWPCVGDRDFNDGLIRYQYEVRDASDENDGSRVTQIILNAFPQALGSGSICSGLALRLPAAFGTVATEPCGDGLECVRRVVGEPPVCGASAPEVEVTVDGNGDTVLWLTNDIRSELCGGEEGYINTDESREIHTCDTIAVTIPFVGATAVHVGQLPFDLFFYRCGERHHQVHRSIYDGTEAFDEGLFDTCDDGSSERDVYFVQGASAPVPGLPFLMNIGEASAYPWETANIDDAFPNIGFFAQDGSHPDFYKVGTVAEYVYQGGANGPPPEPEESCDLPGASCGDGFCDFDESAASCQVDCVCPHEGVTFRSLGLPDETCAEPIVERTAHLASDGSTVITSITCPDSQVAARWDVDSGWILLGDLAGRPVTSQAIAVSSDGSAVVGRSHSERSPSVGEAFFWTGVTGMVGLGDLDGGSFESVALATSSDGSVVVGQGNTQLGPEAFLWAEGSGMVGLGDLDGGSHNSIAFDVSADGSVVVGWGTSASGREAFQWTVEHGMVGLGDLPGGDFSSIANFVSEDGKIVAGYSSSVDGEQAFVWTESGGMVGLGALPRAVGPSATDRFFGASADGSTVLGVSAPVPIEAHRWREATGWVPLGDLPGGGFQSQPVQYPAASVSADGSIVVGDSWVANAPGIAGIEAFVWTEESGMRSVRQRLIEAHSCDLAGWSLNRARGVSANGSSILGVGINPDGEEEFWLVTFPVPNVRLPRTGQTRCFDTAGAEINCDGTGQDGELQNGVAWPSPRLTDNGDGTVTDRLTGLIWLQTPLWCLQTDWEGALAFVADLADGTCGLTDGSSPGDWRLPNILELTSLADFSNSAPALPADHPFLPSGIQAGVYWSSTTHAGDPRQAYTMGLGSGTSGLGDKLVTSLNYVWAVRGRAFSGRLARTGQTRCFDTAGAEINCDGTGQDGELQNGVAWPSPRLTDNGDGTVTDRLTGLIWLQTPLWCLQTDWEGALAFVADLADGTCGLTDGSSPGDWRLPNILELTSLADFSNSAPALPADHPFLPSGIQAGVYWSSTTHAGDPRQAYTMGLGSGTSGLGDKLVTSLNYVWAVRGVRSAAP